MKVLMLSHMYPSPVNPTAGVFVHEQVKALVRLGHDVRVMSPSAWAPPFVARYRAHREVPLTDTIETVPVIYPTKITLPGARLGVRNADAMLVAIRRLCHRIHGRWPFDVIHAHMLVPDGWAAAAVGAELGVPVLATTHRADVLDLPQRSRAQRDQVVQAIESVDQITAVSRAIRDATTALGSPRRDAVVVPNGADTRVFVRRDADEARERLGLPRDRQIISYVGKLVPRKGVDTLIEAFGLLGARQEPTPLLVMAGIGEMRESLERRAEELGVGGDLRFVGKVPHDDVAWWMAAGDVFVLPSLSEGLP
ncbi:MAG: glycosyltransferase, partial [Miltoncostaeaceae bacterium]